MEHLKFQSLTAHAADPGRDMGLVLVDVVVFNGLGAVAGGENVY